MEVNHGGGERRRSLRYDSSGLEMYGDYSKELSMTTLDFSEIIGFNHQIEESKESGEVSGGNDFELKIITWLPTC